MSESAHAPRSSSIPVIRGTQVGLRDPGTVDQIKADMQAGRYAYQELRGRIAGVRDMQGTYHVRVGHHRLAAALEIYEETGDSTAIQLLLNWGFWDNVVSPPIDSRPMPARHWWGAVRNWLGL